MSNGAPPIQVQKKKGIGCFGCGCAICIAIVVLLIAAAVAGFYGIYHVAYSHTSTTGTAVATTDGGDAVYNQAQQKVSSFSDAVEQQQPAKLTLSSEEINTIIARDPNFSRLHNHLSVQLQGDAANVQFSFRLGDLETPDKQIMADRYVNGTASFGVTFDPNLKMFLFDVRSMRLAGQDVPANVSATLGTYISQAVQQQIDGNQAAHDFVGRIQKAQIQDGNLVIEIK